MPDLPRSARPLRQANTFLYASPTSRPTAIWHSDEIAPSTVTETQVMHSQKYYSKDAAEIRNPDDPHEVLNAFVQAAVGARRRLVDALRREERVVDIGVEPTYYYIVECRAVVSAWPMVAGITGPDWELVGQPQSASSRAGSLAHKMSEMYDMWNAEQGRTMRQVIWATRASTRVSDLYREYFAFVVDERVPLGMMQLAVRV